MRPYDDDKRKLEEFTDLGRISGKQWTPSAPALQVDRLRTLRDKYFAKSVMDGIMRYIADKRYFDTIPAEHFAMDLIAPDAAEYDQQAVAEFWSHIVPGDMREDDIPTAFLIGFIDGALEVHEVNLTIARETGRVPPEACPDGLTGEEKGVQISQPVVAELTLQANLIGKFHGTIELQGVHVGVEGSSVLIDHEVASIDVRLPAVARAEGP